MKRNLILFVLTMVAINLSAQKSAREEICENRFICASNYLDYDNYPATKALTPTPKGYEMYYLSHYGRHGSRWLLGDGDYMNVIKPIRDAKESGKLTATGLELLDKLEKFYPGTIGRLGDLTRVGERQHHGIGRRMTEHFPELFSTKGLPIDARSTVVIRCILSMTAECEELTAFNPTAIVHNDVSESLQYYLNEPWRGKVRENGNKGWDIIDGYKEKLTHPDRLIGVLFNDKDWAAEHLKQKSFMRRLFDVATNMQSHDEYEELLDLFTDDECYDLWKIRNIDWYMHYGAAPMTESVMPFSQRNLLKNIISTADTVTTKQATLRFGHEVCVMPLACLLELGSCGAVVENLDTLDNVWRNYNIFPMACNVQLAFYRPSKGKTGDILVKALLNEREMSMPIPTDNYPYYKWSDLRKYYLEKIERYEARNTEDVTIKGSKGKLRAVVHKPLIRDGRRVPFVVIMHGFTGNKNENMLTQISEGLQSRGIGSIRFDFNAHGESEGKFEEMTIANEIEDAAKVLEHVKHLEWVDSTRIGVLGHSQGGVVASMTAGLRGYPSIKGAVLLAPAANIGEGAKKGYLLGRKFDIDNIPDVIDVWNHKVGREYIRVAASMPMYETAAQFTGPALVIHGSKDGAVPCEYGKRYADGYKNGEWILQPDDDHGLSKHRAQTLGHIYSFFEKNL